LNNPNPNLLQAEGPKWSLTLPNSNKAWYIDTISCSHAIHS